MSGRRENDMSKERKITARDQRTASRILPRFREIRKKHSVSQEEIAKVLGLKQNQYSRYERGASKMPLHIAVAFAKHFQCSLDYLVELEEVTRKHV
jgi:transcriptional regulator with XRE-family HTH domain